LLANINQRIFLTTLFLLQYNALVLFHAEGGSQLAAGGATEAPLTEAIDDCGLRFLLAARHHIYLMNTLPLRQRAQLQQTGLGPAYFIWAFHSESEEVCKFSCVLSLIALILNIPIRCR